MNLYELNNEAMKLAADKAADDIRCWMKHALTGAIGTVLITRQIMPAGELASGTAEKFMDELRQFRTEVVDQLDGLDVSVLATMFYPSSPDLSPLVKPDWLSDAEWGVFTKTASAQCSLYAQTAATIAELKVKTVLSVIRGEQ